MWLRDIVTLGHYSTHGKVEVGVQGVSWQASHMDMSHWLSSRTPIAASTVCVRLCSQVLYLRHGACSALKPVGRTANHYCVAPSHNFECYVLRLPCRSAQGAWAVAEREVCRHATSPASASTVQQQAQCSPAWLSSVVGVQPSPWWPGEQLGQ